MQPKFWDNLFLAIDEKWIGVTGADKKADSWHILEIESVRFADAMDGGSEEGIKDDS